MSQRDAAKSLSIPSIIFFFKKGEDINNYNVKICDVQKLIAKKHRVINKMEHR